jgi:hypothetical protein
MAVVDRVDRLWYRSRAELNAEASAVARAVDDYLLEESNGLNVPDPKVGKAVAAIADTADAEVLRLRDGLKGLLRASPFTWRLISAQNCHLYERRRTKDLKLGPNRTKTVTAKEEHPVNRWLRTLSDDVVMAFIREHPQWLRNAAVADRICQWRIDLLSNDPTKRESARQLLEHLAGRSDGRRGRPSTGPRFPARDLGGAVEEVEAQQRIKRETWLRVREEMGAKISLLKLGEVFWQRVHGWDLDSSKEWGLALTRDQAVMHLGRHLVIITQRSGDEIRWVAIDDDGWPRASAVAWLAARWKVSKGWVLKKLAHREK